MPVARALSSPRRAWIAPDKFSVSAIRRDSCQIANFDGRRVRNQGCSYRPLCNRRRGNSNQATLAGTNNTMLPKQPVPPEADGGINTNPRHEPPSWPVPTIQPKSLIAVACSSTQPEPGGISVFRSTTSGGDTGVDPPASRRNARKRNGDVWVGITEMKESPTTSPGPLMSFAEPASKPGSGGITSCVPLFRKMTALIELSPTMSPARLTARAALPAASPGVKSTIGPPTVQENACVGPDPTAVVPTTTAGLALFRPSPSSQFPRLVVGSIDGRPA